jgi:DNA-binding GntR family transcriptional regulator
MLKYQGIKEGLKKQIQQGVYKVGDYLPSESDLCNRFSITRTTVRKAMEELLKEGYIEKQQGKGSKVRERQTSLGLLTVKGFSEAVGQNIQTEFLQSPVLTDWSPEILFPVSEADKKERCLFFERLRKVDNLPVVLERNWFSAIALPGFLKTEFVEGSFFKTLSRKYFIEVIGSSQELRAEKAENHLAELMQMEPGSPVLHISIRFITNHSQLTIYSELYCNTVKFPIGNSYFL